MAGKIIVLRKGANGAVKQEVLQTVAGKLAQVPVMPGEHIAVQIEAVAKAGVANGKAALKSKKVGKDLVLELDGQDVATLTDYFADAGAAGQLDSVTLMDSAGQPWASMVGDGMGGGTSTGSVAGNNAVGLTGTGIEIASDAPIADGLVGLAAPQVAGAFGVAAMALGSVGSSGAFAAAVANTLTGLVMLGPVVADNGLWVHAYDASGNHLGKGKVDATGKYTINLGSYAGPVLVLVEDSNATAADYKDEATGKDLDLATLLSAASVSVAGPNTLNINPLTALAASKVAPAAVTNFEQKQTLVGSLNDAQANNDAIKAAFKLAVDITKTTPDAVNDGSGTSDTLGNLLAAISGLDLLNGGDQSTTLTQLQNLVNGGDVNALAQKLVEGAKAAEANNTTLTNLVSGVSEAIQPVSTAGYSIMTVAGDDVISSTELGATLSGVLPSTVTTATLKLGTTTVPVTVDATTGTWSYTLTPADIAALGVDGAKTITLNDGTNDVASRVIYLDAQDDAPTAVTLQPVTQSLAENADVTTGVKVANIVVSDVDGGTNNLALTGTDASLFEIKNGTELWLKAGTALDFETKASLSVQVTATGGTTPATATSTAYTVAITNVNEAPTAVGTIAAQTAVKNLAFTGLDLNTFFTDVDIAASGDKLTFTLDKALPAGLSLELDANNKPTGKIVGTPTGTSADATYTVTATDLAGLSITQQFHLQVVDKPMISSFTVTDASTTAPNTATLGKNGDALTLNVTFNQAVDISAGASLTVTVNGASHTAICTAGVMGQPSASFTIAALSSAGNGSDIQITALASGTIAAPLANGGQSLLLTTAVAQDTTSLYVVDNTAPTITASYNVNENTASVTTFKTVTLAGSDAHGPITWSGLSGTDTNSFTLSGGTLTFTGQADFETKPSYSLSVTGTDAVGNATTQNITVNLTNVNEAVTLTGLSASTSRQSVVVGVASALADFALVDEDTTNTYSVTLTATGGTLAGLTGHTGVTATATATGFQLSGSKAAINTALAAATFNATASGNASVTFSGDDGVNPLSGTHFLNALAAPVISSKLDNVSNLDVRSSIVMSATENVTAVAGKFIRIVNDGGAGYLGESTTHTQIIEVTDPQVTISGSKITINPTWDLDLANNYHIEIDDGAFVNGSNMGSVAISDSTTINFSTVSPFMATIATAATATTSAVASQKMVAGTDAMVSSGSWFSVMGATSGIGDTSVAAAGATFNLAGGNYVILGGKDTSQTPTDINQSESGISLPFTTWVQLDNFGLNDSIYIDDQFNNAAFPNDIEGDPSAVAEQSLTLSRIAVPASNGQGWFDVTMEAGLSIAKFNSLAELKAATNADAVLIG